MNKQINSKETESKPELYTVLGVVVIALIILGGIVTFSFNLADRIQDKNELRELQKEKLQLEIKIKKRELNNYP
jgi:uncharacterized membrane protein YciS (DUF1049 family)